MVRHEHVGLLEDLGVCDSGAADEHVGRHRNLGHVGDAQRLQLPEAGELLVTAGRRVVANDKGVGQGSPPGGLGPFGRIEQVGGAAQMPANLHVGEGVVVDDLVVLVGIHHPVEVATPVGVEPDP